MDRIKVANELVRLARLLMGVQEIKFDEELVENKRKEVLATLKKFADRIKNPQDMENTRLEVAAYVNDLDRFFYQWLLKDHMYHVERKHESKLLVDSKSLQMSAWDLIIRFKFLDLERSRPEEFEKDKAKIVNRLKRLTKKAFDDAMNVVKYDVKGKSIVIQDDIDLGYAVITPAQGAGMDRLNNVAKIVKEGTELIKQAGLGKVVEPRIIVRVMDTQTRDLGGEYIGVAGNDEIHIYPYSNNEVDVYIHEMGHRSERLLLDSGKQKEWRTFYGENYDLMKSGVSEYAGKNDGEGWAELFMHYVTKKSMPEVLKSKFEVLTGLSKEKTASEKFPMFHSSPLKLKTIAQNSYFSDSGNYSITFGIDKLFQNTKDYGVVYLHRVDVEDIDSLFSNAEKEQGEDASIWKSKKPIHPNHIYEVKISKNEHGGASWKLPAGVQW